MKIPFIGFWGVGEPRKLECRYKVIGAELSLS